ncbi:MAG: response regulator [Deltaproteobacteria bacterium]|nr:response regulator [Deltaproteobacteria bacterium]
MGSLAGTTILLVDDDPLLLRGLSRGLESEGAEVIGVGTVEDGLEQLCEPIDLVITDVNLGPASGLLIARAAAVRVPSVPVLAISGQATVEDAFELGRAGVVAILEKPFGVDILVDAVAKIAPPGEAEIESVARRMVGAASLGDVLGRVRRAMVNEALERADQTKSHAAAELGISRQHLQKLLERGQA